MTGQATMWKLGEVHSNAKSGKFLCLEPLFWQGPLRGQRPSVSFTTDERSRLFWERAKTDLVEQLAAASERVFDAKLTPEAVRQRLLPSVRQSRGGLDAESQAVGPRALLERWRHVCGPPRRAGSLCRAR